MRMLSHNPTGWSWSERNLAPAFSADIFSDFDQLVDSFLRPTYVNTVNFQPSCDVSETKDHYLVSFDMPGVKKEDVKIEIKGNQLVIAGERQREVKNEDGEFTIRHERMYGKFERTFVLPDTIATDKIEAHYDSGVLSIALPKAEAAASKTVQIQTGQTGFLSKLLSSKKDALKDSKDVKIS